MKRPADRPREGWRQRPSTSVAVSSSGAPSSRSGPPAPLRVRTRDAERTVALPPKADRRWRYGDFSLAGYISARRTPARTRHRHSVRPSRRNSHRRSRSPRRRRRFRGRQHRPADRRLDRHRAARHHRGHCHQHLPGRPPRPSARPEHWALGTGHRAPGTGHRAPGTGHRASCSAPRPWRPGSYSSTRRTAPWTHRCPTPTRPGPDRSSRAVLGLALLRPHVTPPQQPPPVTSQPRCRSIWGRRYISGRSSAGGRPPQVRGTMRPRAARRSSCDAADRSGVSTAISSPPCEHGGSGGGRGTEPGGARAGHKRSGYQGDPDEHVVRQRHGCRFHRGRCRRCDTAQAFIEELRQPTNAPGEPRTPRS